MTRLTKSSFYQAYEAFQSLHVEQQGQLLDSFSREDTLYFEWEGYKRDVWLEAQEVLGSCAWQEARIGDGEILERVIRAIEISSNNLVSWPAKRGPTAQSHRTLLEARGNSETTRSLEAIFYQLFYIRKGDEDAFARLVEICGKRYDLIGYLFFISDQERFLPISSGAFDEIFERLGIDLQTSHKCSWSNYQSFIKLMEEVRDELRKHIDDVSLLDAHSFIWFVGRYPSGFAPRGPGEPSLIPFSGHLQSALPMAQGTARDFEVETDMALVQKLRHAAGTLAEECALRHEKERLCAEGRPDLASAVQYVGQYPSRGYDIRSFDSNGAERFVEVKNVSRATRFYLSIGEWRRSRELDNYWFYLVSGIGTSTELIEMLDARLLREDHLKPVSFVVRFTRESDANR